MIDLSTSTSRVWLSVGLAVLLIFALGLTPATDLVTMHGGPVVCKANGAGYSSFIDVQQEYYSGYSSQLYLWYTWISTGDSHVIFFAMSANGLSWEGQALRSPVSMVIGQHFNTKEGELFIGNSPTYMEIYNDTNGNGIPDANFTAGSSEVLYYVLMNSSKSFEPTPIAKQVDTHAVSHYMWGVKYKEIDAFLLHPFIESYPAQHPDISVLIEYLQFSYDYFLTANRSYLKVGFEVGPFSNARTYNINSQQMEPANFTLEGMSLSILFSTLIVAANPSHRVMVGGEQYNSRTTNVAVTPTNNATLDVEDDAVYNFLFGDNYTLITRSGSSTYSSKAAACADDSTPSRFGPLLFSRWHPEAEILQDLIPRISNTLEVSAILDETSSFFYRVSYPWWDNGTVICDPTYVANVHPFQGSGGEILQIILVTVTAGIGIGILSVALLKRKRSSLTYG